MSQPEMRVVHATECAASGTLSVLVSLARELAAAGVSQRVIYSQRGETPHDVEHLFPLGVTFVRVPQAAGFHGAFVSGLHAALTDAVENFEPAVLHLHSSKAGFVGRVARFVHGWPCRVLYSPHGLSFLDPEKKARNAVFRSLEWLAARSGATPVGCGQGEADLLAKLSGRPAMLLENPVEESFLQLARHPATTATVVTMGRLSRQKAPENFAALAQLVRARIPNARFVWIGDGEASYKPILQAANVELTGWVDRHAVAAHLASAHVYAQTSRWEGLPISVIQALATGIPCVVNDCIGNRDAVTDGVTGFVRGSVETLAEGALQLLGDVFLRERMGAAARVEAERRFGRAAFRAQVRSLYRIAESDLPLENLEPHVISA